MSKEEYVRCPRCELNYIKATEKICKVCQQELDNQVSKNISDEEARELGLCPVCKVNYLIEDEVMCADCAKEKEFQDENAENSISGEVYDNEDDDSWRVYVENDDNDVDDFDGVSSAYKDVGIEDDDDMEIVEDEEDGDLDGEDEVIDEEFNDEEFDDDLDEEFDDDVEDEDIDEEFDDDEE